MKKLKSLLAALMCFICAGSMAVFAACSDSDGGSAEPTVSGISVSSNTLSLDMGDSSTLTATVTMSDGSDYTGSVSWTSADSSVATVSEGTVTAVYTGSTTITASAGDYTASCAVTVSAKVTALSISQSSASLTVNGKVKLTASVTMSDSSAYSGSVSWSSSNTSVATVSSSGVVKAVGGGSANITASAEGYSAVCDITVVTATSSGEGIYFTSATADMALDTTEGATAPTITLSDYINSTSTTVDNITWSITAGGDYATLSNGVLTAVAAGTVIVRASNSDGSIYNELTVTIATYEWVTNALDYTYIQSYYTSNGMSVGSAKLSEDLTVGIYTVESGNRLDSSSNVLNINTQGERGIYFTLTSDTNIITATVAGASSSGSAVFVLYDGNGNTTGNTWTVANGVQQSIEVTNLAAGTYYLKDTTSYSGRIYGLTVKQYLEVSDAESITASATTVDFLEGDTYSADGLAVALNYANGSSETLSSSDYTTALYSDSGCTQSVSTTSKLASGTYYVKITDAEYDFTDTYEIYVYALDSIALGFNGTVNVGKGTSSDYASSYNGVYYNQTVKTVYTNGEAYDDTGLTVIATGVLNGSYVNFILDDSWYSIDSSALSNLTATSADCDIDISVTVTANSTSKTASYSVSYVNTAISLNNNSYDSEAYIAVDCNYTGIEGALVTNSSDNIQYNTFSTITKALEYLKIQQSANNISSSTIKIINIAAGYYNEKIEITLANVYMVGAGSTASSSTAITTITDTEKNAGTYTIIEWDSLYGQEDESGYTQVTDSTATFNVRQSATGFYAEGITFSNWYNCVANFANVSHSEHRALAMLIQADQVTLKDCALLGYQDTLELFTGRQYITGCFISGTTDFIFGTNNTTFFTDCTIYSITAETSSGATSSDGGYITAFKGCNSGESDYVTYGAIFYNCTFTADSNVLANKTTAIGRTWGAYAAVAVINCTLGAHISTDGYTSGTSKNQRYVKMSEDPTADTVKFVEYGNTGDGAISEAVAGMTLLDATTAANYYDLSVIFGTTNGAVTYSETWTPSASIPD